MNPSKVEYQKNFIQVTNLPQQQIKLFQDLDLGLEFVYPAGKGSTIMVSHKMNTVDLIFKSSVVFPSEAMEKQEEVLRLSIEKMDEWIDIEQDKFEDEMLIAMIRHSGLTNREELGQLMSSCRSAFVTLQKSNFKAFELRMLNKQGYTASYNYIIPVEYYRSYQCTIMPIAGVRLFKDETTAKEALHQKVDKKEKKKFKEMEEKLFQMAKEVVHSLKFLTIQSQNPNLKSQLFVTNGNLQFYLPHVEFKVENLEENVVAMIKGNTKKKENRIVFYKPEMIQGKESQTFVKSIVEQRKTELHNDKQYILESSEKLNQLILENVTDLFSIYYTKKDSQTKLLSFELEVFFVEKQTSQMYHMHFSNSLGRVPQEEFLSDCINCLQSKTSIASNSSLVQYKNWKHKFSLFWDNSLSMEVKEPQDLCANLLFETKEGDRIETAVKTHELSENYTLLEDVKLYLQEALPQLDEFHIKKELISGNEACQLLYMTDSVKNNNLDNYHTVSILISAILQNDKKSYFSALTALSSSTTQPLLEDPFSEYVYKLHQSFEMLQK